MEDVDVDLLDKQMDSASTSSKKESKENDNLSDEGLVCAVNKNSNKWNVLSPTFLRKQSVVFEF